VAAWVSDIFLNFYLLKNDYIANDSTPATTEEKV